MMSSRRTPLLPVLLVIAFVLVTGGCGKSGGIGLSAPATPTTTTTANGHGGAPGAGTPSTPSSEPTPPPATSPTPKKIIKLADHPLMADPNIGLPNSPACKLPTWGTSRPQVTAYFRAVARCLNDSWSRVLHADNLPFTPPRLYFPTGSKFSSDCGTIKVGIGTAAYSCEGELFLPWRGLQLSQYAGRPGVYVALIAHEYGHHVQELAGIMDAVWNVIYDKGQTSQPGLLMSRRKELQAQCFSGMFMGSQVGRGGSITREMYLDAWKDQATRGDDTSGGHEHGTNADYAMWWRRGAMDNRVHDCNTFTASKKEVK